MDIVKNDLKYLVCASGHARRVLEDYKKQLVKLCRDFSVIPLFAIGEGEELIFLPARNTYEDEIIRVNKEIELTDKHREETGTDEIIEYGEPITHEEDMIIEWNGNPTQDQKQESKSLYERLKSNKLLESSLVFKISDVAEMMAVLNNINEYLPFYFRQPERLEMIKNEDGVIDIFYAEFYSVGG